MNRIKIFVALLIFSAFLFQSCVKDELFVDTNVDSDVVLVINEVNSNAGDPIFRALVYMTNLLLFSHFLPELLCQPEVILRWCAMLH